MKRLLPLALAFFVVTTLVAARNKTVTGWVSDAACGAEHTKPGGADCIKKCIKGAVEKNPAWTSQKMVFVTDGDKKVWVVENPDALKDQEGLHLKLTASFDEKKNTVRVKSFESVEEKPR